MKKNTFLMTSALSILSAFVTSFPQGAMAGEKAAAPAVNSEEIFKEIRACKELQDPDAYDKNNVDAYTMMLPGNDGWLFRTKNDFKMDYTPDEASISKLLQLQNALEKKGIKLYITYTPNRGIMASSHIPKGNPIAASFDVAKAKSSYDNMAKTLRKNGVRFITYDQTINAEKFFRKTDQHWNTNGAREMAKVVAAQIKKDSVYKNLKKSSFETVSKGAYDFPGRFAEPVKKLCDITLAREQDEEVLTSLKGASTDSKGLFGDATVPQVVLVGTSNSKAENFNSNYDGFLKEYLQVDVLNAAMPGMGIDEPMIAYLQSSEFRDTPPKVIVWEIPGYYVMSKDETRFLDEIIPAVIGACDKPVAEFNDVELSETEQTLLSDLQSKKLMGDAYYLQMQFATPIDKKFKVSFNYADSDDAKHIFKRSKRFPFDGIFYTILPDKDAKGDGKATLSMISISPDKKMMGQKVSGKVCAIPSSLVSKD